MHPVRKQRLIIVLCVVAFSSLAIGLAVYALRGNINLFYPPAEVAAGLAPEGTPIRVIRRSARMSHAWGAMPLAKFAAAVLADKGAGCDSHAAERVCAAPRLELADCTGLRRAGALTPSGWL